MKQLKRDAPFRGKRKSFVFRFKNEKCCPGLTLIYCSSFCPSSIGEMTYKPRTKPNFDLYCHMMLFTSLAARQLSNPVKLVLPIEKSCI